MPILKLQMDIGTDRCYGEQMANRQTHRQADALLVGAVAYYRTILRCHLKLQTPMRSTLTSHVLVAVPQDSAQPELSHAIPVLSLIANALLKVQHTSQHCEQASQHITKVMTLQAQVCSSRSA